MLQLRLRSPTGTSTLSLDPAATLADLRQHTERATGIRAASQDLRVGFPPKAIDPAAAPTTPLSSLGVKTGETVVVAEGTVAASSTSTASVPQKRAISPAAVPSARKAPAAQIVAPPESTVASDAPPFVEADGGFLVLRQVPDDNSCLFRAVGLVLNPGETDVAASLRRVVAGAIQADPAEYSEAVLGRPPAQYIETILKRSSWGGAIELAVFAKHFRTEIWSIDVQTGRVDRFGEGAEFETFALIVYSGIHYDSLTFSFSPPQPSTSFPPLNLDFDTTVFPRYQEHLLESAQKLVAQLRAQHAYTDTASFTLKCGDCGQALTGEKEARRHAETTGHTSFTEYDE
ncbi:hypothetical protein JCM3770_006838 [Rhodotorula araucariae]